MAARTDGNFLEREKMKESFILHKEYIEDLPEEYKLSFLSYCYDYGINGIKPELKGLELALWLKIQRRIDAEQEAWEETKNARAVSGKIGGVKSGEIRRSKTKQNEALLQNAKQNEANEANASIASSERSNASKNEANEAVNVYVSDYVYVNDVVSVEEQNTNTLNKIINTYDFDLTENQQKKIIDHLKEKELPAAFLEYVINYLLTNYKNVETGLFYTAVISWDKLIKEFKAVDKPKKAKNEKPPELKKCPICGANLIWINTGQMFCNMCRKDYKYINSEWVEAE